MRILVAPQEFKGTLTAERVAETIAQAIASVDSSLELDVVPLADGGAGTVDVLLRVLGGERRPCSVEDPLGREHQASWALLSTHDAALEMAAASGLTLLSTNELDPLRASTFGTGQLIAAALDAGCRRVLVGAGGSATNDAGVGAVRALGVRFFDAAGGELTCLPRDLGKLHHIDLGGLHRALATSELIILTDVQNPLCGPEGASRIFGPQKGADFEMTDRLDELLMHLAQVVREQTGQQLEHVPGSGAAGGLAYGLAALAGGKIVSGFNTLSESLGLLDRMEKADLVITGEGRLDSQTAYFKGPYSLACLARMRNKRVVMFAGVVATSSGTAKNNFDEVISASPPESLPPAGEEEAAARLTVAVRDWALGLRRQG